MKKAALFRRLHYRLTRRGMMDYEIPDEVGRCGILKEAERASLKTSEHYASVSSTQFSSFATVPKLGFPAVATSGETLLFASTKAHHYDVANLHRRCFSSVSESREDVGGIIPIPLAQTGEGIADCELLRWFVQEGDEVEEFQPICEVQSDKASVEITSRYKGKVSRVYYIPGDIVKVGETLLELIMEGDDNRAPLTDMVGKSESEDISLDPYDASSKPVGGHENVQATPSVRQLAKTCGLALADIPGSGKDGRILKEDVVKFALLKEKVTDDIRAMSNPVRGAQDISLESGFLPASSSDSKIELDDIKIDRHELFSKEDLPFGDLPVALTAAVEGHSERDKIIPIRGYRRIMAKTMAATVNVPHFHFTEEIDVNALVQLKDSLKNMLLERGVKLTYLPFLIKALSQALMEYPIMNSTVNEDVSEIKVHASHHIGIGMATPSGLVVPNLKNVQRLSILEIAEEIARLTQLAATSKLSSEDVTGGTITVSNFGSIGGKYGSPILNLPEVAIVAIGRIQKLPRYTEDGRLYPASIMGVTWGADHRVIDGATVASFCNHWKMLVEQPGRFLLSMN